jgi:V/A-type H+-transporting ATPase subunit E
MALEDILRKIEEDAKREADKILSEAKERAEEIIRNAQEEADRAKGRLMEEARRNAQTHKSRLISMAELDMRKEVLQEKQSLIDLAFRKALERLTGMEDDEYRTLIERMLMQSVEYGDEEIILCERDKSRISQGFIQAFNKKLESEGKLGKLTIAEETGDFSGGFILRRGKIELNNTFDALLQAARGELETEISQILFGE